MMWAIVLAAISVNVPDRIWVKGIGQESCASALSAERYQASSQWVLGYFTGLNTTGTGMVGQTTDASGIMGEVKLVCSAEPSTSLINAASRVYRMLAAQKR